MAQLSTPNNNNNNYAPSAPPAFALHETVDDVASPVLGQQSPAQVHNPPSPQVPQAYAQPQYASPPLGYAPPPVYGQPPPGVFAPVPQGYAQPLPQPVFATPIPVYGGPSLPPNQFGAPMALPTPAMYDEKHAVRMHNFIFVGSHGKIMALEIGEGAVRTVWVEELKGCGYHMVHLHLFIARGHLFAATNGHVFCFEALTGKILWRQKPDIQHGILASDLMTLLCTYDGSIIVTASNGALVAFNALTGQMIWQRAIDGFTGCHDAYALLEHKGILYVGNEGYVYAYYMINGQLKWKNGLSGFGFCPISLAAYAFCPPGGIIYDILFVGTYGYILALDGQSGSTRHHVNLDGTGYKPVALLLDPPSDTLYTATSGELRCFRAESMQLLWKSNLPGMGYSFGHSLLFLDPHTIAIGMHGKVAALNKQTSKIEWQTSLPGCGYHLVTVAAVGNPNNIVCGSSGKLYGLTKKGEVLWKDGLKGMGYASISLSTTVYNTDFNSTTLPQDMEMERRQRRNNNGGAVGVAIASAH